MKIFFGFYYYFVSHVDHAHGTQSGPQGMDDGSPNSSPYFNQR